MTTAHIPVVLLTAKALNEHIEEGYGAMADDYVLKPFAPKVLLAKLESIIKNRNRLRQPVSYTHLDVYKRQGLTLSNQYLHIAVEST